MKSNNFLGNKYFVLYYKENRENVNFRYAIGVSKKFGNAVSRNQIKRRIKEIIKTNDFDRKYDFFIIVRNKTTDLKFNEIKLKLEKLFCESNLLRKKENV